MDREFFWKIRSDNYDKLFWVSDDSYLDFIIKHIEFKNDDVVLDVGSGTGVVAVAIKPYVKHVIAIDISEAMFEKGKWQGISVVKWDISNALFLPRLFDKITARMVFHHIFDDLDRVIVRCYDLLKMGGELIVAEGVPPTDDDDVVEWYTDMFRLKETRRTFKSNEVARYLGKNGFVNIRTSTHIMKNFSIRNWLENSGIDRETMEKIMNIHFNAPQKIKDAYKMEIVGDDCLVNTKNVLTIGNRN